MKKTIIILIALLFNGAAFAMDGMSVEAGSGMDTNTGRVGAIWNFDHKWLTDNQWQVSGFWEAMAGRWSGHSNNSDNQTITDISLTPVFRLQQKLTTGVSPYLEGAIGIHLISPNFIYQNRRFGSTFQFGDHIGAGICFGEHHQFDLGYRFQHLSNGGIKQPNEGINLNEIHFIYHI
jgi:lipid A 3-O-deacylase